MILHKGYLEAAPPELRPKQDGPNLTRKVTCPGCGRVFWTNRETDYRFDCEKKQNRGTWNREKKTKRGQHAK